MQKSSLHLYLAGQKLASQRIAEERSERLRALSTTQAAEDYANLCALYYDTPRIEAATDLCGAHLKSLLKLRSVLQVAYSRTILERS
jgi:hypothetical protein